MYRSKDNLIDTVLPLRGCYLCCFVAKSVQFHFSLFCRKTYFVAIYVLFMWRKIKPIFFCGAKIMNMIYAVKTPSLRWKDVVRFVVATLIAISK